MKKMTTPMNAWLNLRQLVDAVSSDTDYRSIDERSQRLLEWIVVNHSPEQPMFVQTIVMKSNVASPATIHKGLSILEREGLISVKVDTSDTRRRIVTPTDRAKKLMAKLSQKARTWAEGLST
jgi:DNA-binding MarR family transcriptional regulator